jgi:hypothetical protein
MCSTPKRIGIRAGVEYLFIPGLPGLFLGPFSAPTVQMLEMSKYTT